jgi:hypothetical protein
MSNGQRHEHEHSSGNKPQLTSNLNARHEQGRLARGKTLGSAGLDRLTGNHPNLCFEYNCVSIKKLSAH